MLADDPSGVGIDQRTDSDVQSELETDAVIQIEPPEPKNWIHLLHFQTGTLSSFSLLRTFLACHNTPVNHRQPMSVLLRLARLDGRHHRRMVYMPEDELVARIKELANDPRRRTSMAERFPDLLSQPLPAPATRKAVQDAETRMGFPLPPLLCKLWTQVANGGFGPGYGLFGVAGGHVSELSLSVPNGYLQLIADASYVWPKKLVIISEWGCGYFSAIDCSTVEGEVVDLLDEPERWAKGFNFAQWMEDWVNGVDLWTRDFSNLGPNPTGTGA